MADCLIFGNCVTIFVLNVPQTQVGRGVLWESLRSGPEGHLQRLLQERGQEAPARRVPYPDRPAGGVPAPLQHPVQPPAGVVSPRVLTAKTAFFI